MVRDAAERWAPAGRRDPVRGGAHLRPLVGGRHPRPPRPPRLRLHDRLRPRSGRIRRTIPARVAAWVEGRPLARDRRAVLRRGRGRGPLRPVRHARPPRRRQALPPSARHEARRSPARPSCTSRSCARSSRAGRRSRSTPAASATRSAETYPSAADRRPLPRARRPGDLGRVRRPPGRALRLGPRGRLSIGRRRRLRGARLPAWRRRARGHRRYPSPSLGRS